FSGTDETTSFLIRLHAISKDLHFSLHDALPIWMIGERNALDHLERLQVRDVERRFGFVGHVEAAAVGRRGGAVVHLDAADFADRSEEHTSELQSRSELVCRPLPGQKIWPSRCAM